MQEYSDLQHLYREAEQQAPTSVPRLVRETPIAPPPEPSPVKGFVAPRSGYYDTIWPSEHTDLWRSHAAPNSGLPVDFDAAKLQTSTAPLLEPLWGYTRKANEVFVVGGSPVTLKIFTDSIVNGQSKGLPKSGAGSEARRMTPYVARVNHLTMATELVEMTRGVTLNYTGGLLMHQNGYVYAVAQSVLYKINPDSMQIEASVGLPFVGEGWPQHFWTTYNGMQVMASGRLIVKGFDFVNSVDIAGWLLLVDPDTLEIKVQQSENVCSARLSIRQYPDGTAHLYHITATDLVRYNVHPEGFKLDQPYTSPYREAQGPSTQASSPLLFAEIDQNVFANNTAPGATVPISLFIQSMKNPVGHPLRGVPAFNIQEPGYNFFMVAGDPFESQIVFYYDPINNLMSTHQVTPQGELQPLWENNRYKASASPAV